MNNISLFLFLPQITFDFTNIGSVLGAAVSLIGSFAIDFGRGLIVDGVKKVLNLVSRGKWKLLVQVITEQLPSLLCEDDLNRNITLMPPLNPAPLSPA